MYAPLIATKGHFYQIATDLGETVPPIKDHSGKVIVPDSENDDTYLGIESISGMTLIAR